MMLSAIEMKDIVRRQWFEELWDKWNVSIADALFTSDYQLHLSGVIAPLSRVTATDVVRMLGDAFPDLRHTVNELIAEGNTVVARWTMNGTHCGELHGIAATERSIRISGTAVHHLSGNKIAETWLTFDNLDLLQQLGATLRPAES